MIAQNRQFPPTYSRKWPLEGQGERGMRNRGFLASASALRVFFRGDTMDGEVNGSVQRYARGQNPASVATRFKPGNKAAAGKLRGKSGERVRRQAEYDAWIEAGMPDVPFEQQMWWVLGALGVDNPPGCPCPTAWALLDQARKDPDWLFGKILPKMVEAVPKQARAQGLVIAEPDTGGCGGTGDVSTAHLQGRRSGRRKGSRSTPAWERALRWAGRHMGKPDAVPPSDLAGRLAALGRDHPDRLVSLLLQLDAERRRGAADAPAPEPAAPIPSPPPALPQPAEGTARRLKRLSLPGVYLVPIPERPRRALACPCPPAYEIVGLAVDQARGRVVVTIRSEALQFVAEEQAIPIVEC